MTWAARERVSTPRDALSCTPRRRTLRRALTPAVPPERPSPEHRTHEHREHLNTWTADDEGRRHRPAARGDPPRAGGRRLRVAPRGTGRRRDRPEPHRQWRTTGRPAPGRVRRRERRGRRHRWRPGHGPAGLHRLHHAPADPAHRVASAQLDRWRPTALRRGRRRPRRVRGATPADRRTTRAAQDRVPGPRTEKSATDGPTDTPRNPVQQGTAPSGGGSGVAPPDATRSAVPATTDEPPPERAGLAPDPTPPAPRHRPVTTSGSSPPRR